jgi:phosphoesterase RecJ-like protein
MRITIKECAGLIKERDNILILTHKSPDGDTIGSACALSYALNNLGKKSKILFAEKVPAKYDYLINKLPKDDDFETDTVISIDIATESLLGSLYDYKDKIDICIDHHISNNLSAKVTLLDGYAAAAAEIVYELILELGVEITKDIANALYTGISTDTGCFKFSNTTARTHVIAAELMMAGAEVEDINHRMFESKSKASIELEKRAINTLEYFADGKIAVITVTADMLKETGAEDSDLDAVNAIPKKIDGVLAGITIKEKVPGEYRVSVRTHAPVNAAEICALFGGGGHIRAGGCTLDAPLDENKKRLIEAVENIL